MRGREPGNLHIKLSFIQRQRAFHNARRDWPGNTATMFATLHHRRDDIFGIIKRSETSEPGDGILVAAIGGLGGSGLSSHLHIFQSRSSAGAAIFIDNFPKAFAHEIDLFSRKLTT